MISALHRPVARAGTEAVTVETPRAAPPSPPPTQPLADASSRSHAAYPQEGARVGRRRDGCGRDLRGGGRRRGGRCRLLLLGRRERHNEGSGGQEEDTADAELHIFLGLLELGVWSWVCESGIAGEFVNSERYPTQQYNSP